MKKQFILFFFVFGFIHAVLSNDTIASKIVFYREYNYYGSAISYKIFVNDSMVVKLKNNSFFVYNCLPGDYDIEINKFKEPKLHLKVEKGKTYYLKFGIRMGVWSGIPELILVDSVSAYPTISSGSMRELNNNIPLVRPKNRFGLNINIGGGFERIPMIEMDNGKEAKISFGGGFGIGIKYGHEFNKHFDLALDLNYQFSLLSPTLKNADISFKRGFVSITPSYILAIDGGDAMRLKFGGGLDYYWGTLLTIESSEVSGGFDDEWKYRSSLGYHVNVIFELNISDNWSVNYGLNWYNVGYEFKSSRNFFPTDNNKLKQPDGSGIDFLFGFYYHF